MGKYDVKRELKSLYAPKNTSWELVDVLPQQFIAVDGAGDPNTSSEYTNAVEALFTVAYAIKFASKAEGQDLVVGPLEGLWWADDPEVFIARDKAAWSWRMLISQPDWIGVDIIDDAKLRAAKKKDNPAIAEVCREGMYEGTCAQALHVGSYDDEGPVLAELRDTFIPANELRMSGLHHEVYLSDPRRTEPAKLKTVLRQPLVVAAGGS